MLKLMEDFPEGVVAISASGRVTAADYQQLLIPKVEEMIERRGSVRLYYELGRDFDGIDAEAAWKDFKLGVEHFSRWERMALVTDVDWIKFAVRTFGFVMPGRLKVFPTDRSTEARAWILESQPA